MRLRHITAAALGLLAAGLAYAQEGSLDDLFDDPVEDTVVKNAEVDHLAQFTTYSGIKFRGNFNAEGGISAGWTSWPDLGDISSGFDGMIGLIPTATLYADARPDPDFRFYGYVTTSMNPVGGAYTWTGFSIGELFIDYTWLGNVFIRLGKHDIAWGQARLFESVTDIMADAVSGFCFRASVPTLLDGFSALALINQGGITSYKQLTYAAKADKVLLGTMVSIGARWQIDAGLDALASLKKIIWHTDVFSDIIVHYDADSSYAKVLAGFYREWSDFKLYGEYWYDGSNASTLDQTIGIAFGYNNLGGTTIDIGIQAIHAFVDQSGSVTPALTWKPWKFIEATVAMPIAYGADGSRYVSSANVDPGKRRLALVFGLELDVSF